MAAAAADDDDGPLSWPLFFLPLRTLKLTTEGVVKLPRALGTTTGWPSTITATAELVVPFSSFVQGGGVVGGFGGEAR